MPTWEGHDFTACDRVLSGAMRRGERIYSAACIVPNPPFGEARKHGNHPRLIEHAMAGGLPGRTTAAGNLQAIYEALRALPSLGPFLAYQYAIDLAYSGLPAPTNRSSSSPAQARGISKCFTDTAGLPPAEIIAWMHDTSRDHFDRLGLDFTDLWGRWPTLIDWQNVLCEVSKYTRATHPHIRGASGRSRIKQEFRENPVPVDYRFPPKWGLPDRQTARVTAT